MSLQGFLVGALLTMGLLIVNVAQAACDEGGATCVASCARFDPIDVRRSACENVCRQACRPASAASAAMRGSRPEARAYAKKRDALHERELNGAMLKAISAGNLKEIRRLVETKGLSPTYAYDFEFNPQTRQYEGRAVKLRLVDIFADTVTVRSDAEGLDKILTLLIELGMDVTATLPAVGAVDSAPSPERTAWGPSLKFMERARDRNARMQAFEIALEKGLKPNEDVGEWLFAELRDVCGRDRSEYAIQVVDLLVKHLGTSLQEAFWRIGERGPESVSDVLDRLMSPGRVPRSTYERNQFAEMDKTWENCALLSRRINRYLMEGK